ncbi:hypothetical protein [Streptantibioticus silvisoli]|uniref:Secreted protein n=1 Tax=Streptantibioticus silvisoli TaxID=2705255 RepID=A0ABT6W239_9ACTN|nr:hypothetical protein [Streptantibioticus silvisoli]MDI5964807.1 hypothetical protein [Streptantibioticus silvisoli]
MEAVLGVIALFMIVAVSVGTFLLVKAARAVQRGVERTSVQARRVVEETTLKAKRVQPGPAGQLAALRLELRTSMVDTRHALESGIPADPSLTEALALLERLRAHAHALDDELRLLEREPDRTRLAARLPELRERTGRVTHSADSLRWAAQDRARQFDDDDLAALGRQIEVEAGALRHWVPTDLSEGEGESAGPGQVPGSGQVPGAGWISGAEERGKLR